MTNRTVLITGCSSGFGKLAARHFHAAGWNVAATMRRPEAETELIGDDRMLVLCLDVCDTASVEAAAAATVERFGAIDVAINNAAFGGNALFEQSDDAFVRAMYETNVFGLMAVSRAVLPAMRARGEGALINVSSMAGMIGIPGNSIYSSTKFAVEGLTEALAFEYEPLGVRICTVAPGAYGATRFTDNIARELDRGDAALVTHAHALRDHFAAAVAAGGGQEADPQEVVDLLYRCATESMPVHNPVGSDAQMLAGLIEASDRQTFLGNVRPLLMPAGDPA